MIRDRLLALLRRPTTEAWTDHPRSFRFNVLTLATGTTIAQALPLALSPVLTRLYTPRDFGVFALYMAVASILAAGATARYELAVLLPERDDDADGILLLSIAIAAATSLLSAIVLVFSAPTIDQLLGRGRLAGWLYVVPLSLFLAASYNSLNYWLNRHRRYAEMSQARILQSAVGGAAQLGFGWLGLGMGGLIIGGIVGQLAPVLFLARQLRSASCRRSTPHRQNARNIKQLAARYKHHPQYLLPAHLIGTAALQLPLLIFSSAFGTAVAGLFALAHRMVTVPTLLVATSIGDVYREHASRAYRQKGEFRSLFLTTLRRCAQLAAIPYLLLSATAPYLFPALFGERWRSAGDYACILALAGFFQFVFTPGDKGAIIVGATKYVFCWHLARLAGITTLLVLTHALSLPVIPVLWLLVLVNASLYVVDGVVEYRFSGPAPSRSALPRSGATGDGIGTNRAEVLG